MAPVFIKVLQGFFANSGKCPPDLFSCVLLEDKSLNLTFCLPANFDPSGCKWNEVLKPAAHQCSEGRAPHLLEVHM